MKGFEYTVATGRLFMKIADFHREAEQLLGRPIFTHEFGDEKTWIELRIALEAGLLQEALR